jgi:hypothetical protein
MLKKIFQATTLVLSVTIIASLAQPSALFAVSAGDWKAGNIIDDSVFTDSSALSVQQIQSFLDSQIGTCDTNGTQLSEYGGGTRAEYGAANGNPAPFTCLNNYYEVPKTSPGPDAPISNYGTNTIPAGAQSAAQIISNASQTYNISPAVLLVKLATESPGPLTNDDWPFKKQYLYAMGARCPDSGPGGSANCDVNYSGFSLQMLEAAKLLRGYLDNMTQPWWTYKKPYQTNSILWNVVERGCGAADVFIQNKATAALYTYTPYQPNQAALNNLYGTGDNCSAYGNRNFWRVFNDFFSYLNKPLVRTESSGALFYIDGSVKHPVNSMQIVTELGLSTDDVRFVSQSYLDSKATASTPLSYLIKSTSDSDADGGNLYLVSKGKRHLLTSMTQLTAFNLTVDSISYLPYSDILLMPLAGNLSSFVTRPNGFTFRIVNDKKSAIFQQTVLSSLNPSGYTSQLSDHVISTILPTTPTIDKYLALVDRSNGKVWVSTGDQWSYVPSMDILSCYNIASTLSFSTSEVSIGAQSDTASCVAKTSGGDDYLLNKDNKFPLDSSWGLSTKNVVSDLIVTSKTNAQTSSTSPFLVPTGEIYLLEGGKKRHVTSMTALSDNSFSTTVFHRVNSSTISAIPNGTKVYRDGTLLQNSQTGQIYVVAGDSLIYIDSMTTFNAYGFKSTGIIGTNQQTIDSYTVNGGSLKTMANFGSNVYIANKISRVLIPSDQSTNFGTAGLETYPVGLLSNITQTVQGTRYLKATNSAQLYVMDAGQKRPVYSWNKFVELGGNNNNITSIDPGVLALIPTGTAY